LEEQKGLVVVVVVVVVWVRDANESTASIIHHPQQKTHQPRLTRHT
jgi:hypothetical protein